MALQILVVDDERVICNMIATYLEKNGRFKVEIAETVEAAKEILHSSPIDVVITDKNMPDPEGGLEGGISLLKYVKSTFPVIEVIMITGYGTIESAIEAMKLGAFDFISKPFSQQAIKDKIDRIAEYKSFLNPDNIFQIYKGLHNDVMDLLEKRSQISGDQCQAMLRSIETRIDHFFKAQKDWERVIIGQREALARIGAYVEQLREIADYEGDAGKLLDAITQEANRRI